MRKGATPPALSRAAGFVAVALDRLAARGRDRTGLIQRAARTAGAASCVRTPLRFAGRELAGGTRTAAYELAPVPGTALVRHPLVDMWVLEEVFRFGAYRIPPPVRERLDGLGRPIDVLDIGGHVGYFGLFVLSCFPDAAILSYEADPRNAATLRRCAGRIAPPASWEVVQAAASNRSGILDFVSSFQLSGAAADVDVESDLEQLKKPFPFLSRSELDRPRRVEVERVDVLGAGHSCDLLKIDIEGGEWDLLGDDRFATLGATAVVLEFHPAGCPASDPLAEVERVLDGAGYETGYLVPGDAGEGVLWAWR